MEIVTATKGIVKIAKIAHTIGKYRAEKEKAIRKSPNRLIFFGGPPETRTPDPLIKRKMALLARC
jgi:hypothetical protein